jgi:hypothetical protein
MCRRLSAVISSLRVTRGLGLETASKEGALWDVDPQQKPGLHAHSSHVRTHGSGNAHCALQISRELTRVPIKVLDSPPSGGRLLLVIIYTELPGGARR